MEFNQENIDKFMAELEELSKKYNIIVSGCGCCNSPYLIHCNDINEDCYGKPLIEGHYTSCIFN